MVTTIGSFGSGRRLIATEYYKKLEGESNMVAGLGSIKIGAFDREVFNCPVCKKEVDVKRNGREVYECCGIEATTREKWNEYCENIMKAHKYDRLTECADKQALNSAPLREVLDFFESMYGCRLYVGMNVKVSSSCSYYEDYQGITLIVVGIEWKHQEQSISLTLGEELDGFVHDGWRLSDIIPVY